MSLPRSWWILPFGLGARHWFKGPQTQFHTSDSAYFDLQPAQGDTFLESVGKNMPVVV